LAGGRKRESSLMHNIWQWGLPLLAKGERIIEQQSAMDKAMRYELLGDLASALTLVVVSHHKFRFLTVSAWHKS
jgi:hypothetical protein